MSALVARARGLSGRLIADDALVAIERADDDRALRAALARAQILDAAAPAVEGTLQARLAEELAILVRWAGGDAAAVAVIELDEDRRSLRNLVRRLAAGVAVDARADGCVPTSSLPSKVLADLAASTSVLELGLRLASLAHPLARAFPAEVAGPIDLLELEVALDRAFAELAAGRSSRAAHDLALATYLAQRSDVANAGAALLLAARGEGLEREHLFVPGGARVQRDAFLAAAAATPDVSRARLVDAFTGTPIATAIESGSPGALEDAALAWEISTQRQLRREHPHGLATVLYLVLRRRDEARRLRRAAWRIALGRAA